MTNKITGYQNRPVQVGTDKTVSRTREAGAQSTQSATTGAASPINITEQARQLAALERAVQSLPIVNEARVAEIRLALEEGRYEISPERVAEKLLRLERELAGTEQ